MAMSRCRRPPSSRLAGASGTNGVCFVLTSDSPPYTCGTFPSTLYFTVTGTILNDGVIPSDCNLSRADASTVSLTCSNRSPSQRWVETIGCGEDRRSEIVNGNTVTGNGTSTARCTHYAYNFSSFTVLQ
ncbi:MAG: hypothetical protein ABJA86_07850 [Nocardioidaceae bacterium]